MVEMSSSARIDVSIMLALDTDRRWITRTGGGRSEGSGRESGCYLWHGRGRVVTPGSATAASDLGIQVGLVIAGAKLPETFAPGLGPRSAVDQGVATALSTGLHYLLSLGTQEAIEALAAELARSGLGARWADVVTRQRALTVLTDVAAIPAGLAIQALVPSHPGEATLRGALRQSGWRAATTGAGALCLAATRWGLGTVDTRVGANGRLEATPIAVPLGLAIAWLVHRRTAYAPEPHAYESADGRDMLRSLLVAGGIEGGLVAAAYAEHLLAGQVGARLSARLPAGPEVWRLAAHAASLGLLALGVSALWTRGMHRIETGSDVEESMFGNRDTTRWTAPTQSGGPGSLVPWSNLGREGRRHMLAYVRPAPVADRPEGVPDLSIETVMGESAAAEPVQVYVGLDSAATPRERVDLALAEMDRTGAFDRSLIMLVSPTGTGYVNYVAVAAAQYLTRGDMASVTLQYSKRPSPLSLSKVGQAREQNRLLWLRILERLQHTSGPRPRVVLFGESLGAHTSQDVFLHWGTLGPQALGIDRALWIGTPYGSGWMHEVTGPDRLDVDRDTLAVVNDFEQLEELGEERLSRIRYVMLSHDNDGVTRFGLDLLTTRPTWLGPNRPRPEAAARGASPRGIDPRLRWRPITTFFHTLIDMKNAQLPGEYLAWGHDYRPDLPRFISAVYGLPATTAQLDRIATAVQQRETLRERAFEDL